jgi:hypothetical protein
MTLKHPKLSLVAETLTDSEISPKKEPTPKPMVKSKSAIFSRQRETRFKAGIFPG